MRTAELHSAAGIATSLVNRGGGGGWAGLVLSGPSGPDSLHWVTSSAAARAGPCEWALMEHLQDLHMIRMMLRFDVSSEKLLQ